MEEFEEIDSAILQFVCEACSLAATSRGLLAIGVSVGSRNRCPPLPARIVGNGTVDHNETPFAFHLFVAVKFFSESLIHLIRTNRRPFCFILATSTDRSPPPGPFLH